MEQGPWLGVEEKRDVDTDGGWGTESKGKKAKKERITSSFIETPICQLLLFV